LNIKEIRNFGNRTKISLVLVSVLILSIALVSTTSISSLNRLPVAQDMNLTTPVDSTKTFVLNATADEGSNIFNFTILTSPAKGIISSFDSFSGAVTYTPSVAGGDSFAFKAVDKNGTESNIGIVTIRNIK
jgi:hypothetical protein